MLVDFRPAESRIFTRRPDVSTSVWAEDNIVIKKSSMPGPFRNRVTPYLAGILDMFDMPHVREIDLCKGVQTAGTTAAYICLARRTSESSNTGLLVMADEKTVKSRMKHHVIPMYRDSGPLSALLSPNPDDTANIGLTLAHGYNIKTGWGASTASLASDPCEDVVLDEIDKYQSRQNIEEAKDRTSTYPDTSKIFALSTPGLEDGPIWQELQSCDAVYDFHPICPSCGVQQTMEWEFFKWPEGVGFKEIRRRHLAWYQCPHCDARWGDNERNMAVSAGADTPHKGWLPRVAVERPSKVGFFLPSWLSRFVSISKVVAERIEADELAKTGDDAKLHHWFNNRAALPYIPEKSERKEDQILRLVDPSMPRGTVPRDASTVLLLVDTQSVGFFYQVWAYGWGRDLETWRIDHGFLERFDHLADVYDREWKDADGNPHRAQLAFIDSGGGTNPFHPKHSRTAEVYEFCRRNPMFKPVKGRREQSQPWNATKIDYYPSRDGAKVPIPGGLTLYTLNVTLYKNELARKLQIEPSDPGAFHLHAEMGEDYAKQMVAEYQDERGWWECPKGKANHHWDIGVYGMAAADILRLKDRQRPTEAVEQKQRPKAEKSRRW